MITTFALIKVLNLLGALHVYKGQSVEVKGVTVSGVTPPPGPEVLGVV